MNVNEIMVTEVKTCSRETTLAEIARLMWDNDCGAIPVVNQQGKPVGIVTDRDIAMSSMLNQKPLWELNADQVIQGQRLSTCQQESAVEDCLTKMEQNGIRRLPVVDGKGRLAGIVSIGDTLAFANKSGGASRTRQAGNGVPVQDLVSMMQHVSAHHGSGQHEVTRSS